MYLISTRKITSAQIDDILIRVTSVKTYTVSGIASGKFVAYLRTGNTVGSVANILCKLKRNYCIFIINDGVCITSNSNDIFSCLSFVAGKSVIVGIITIVACHFFYREL